MTNRSRWGVAVVAMLVAVATMGLSGPAAQDASRSRVEGIWQGTLQGMLRLVVHVERGSAGVKATLDSPDQGAMGLKIDTLSFERDSLKFELRAIRGRYEGRMNAAGDTIEGRWGQSGLSLPLVLARTARPTLPSRPQESWPPYPYDTVAVAFDNPKAPGVRLAGTLTLPRGAGPFPCAVLVTGSGPEDRDETIYGHRPFRVIADRLTRKGIAVLRMDDRGVGGSTGSFARATSEDFAGDVTAAVAFLVAQGRIDRRRIGLIGHSEGGLIAPLVATRSSDVAFLVLLAGPGIPGDSTLLLQSAALRRAIGVSEDAIERERLASHRLYAALKAGDSLEVANAGRALVRVQLEGLPIAQRRAAGDEDSLAEAAARRLFSPWMRFFVAYDPRPTLERVRCPVLAVNGSKDLQVLPRENLGAIERALKSGGNRDVTIREMPGLNHLFQTCVTCSVIEYGQLEETVAPAVLDLMSEWIQKHAAQKR